MTRKCEEKINTIQYNMNIQIRDYLFFKVLSHDKCKTKSLNCVFFFIPAGLRHAKEVKLCKTDITPNGII